MKYVSQGAMHIHTTFSDGTSDIKQIARYAKLAGLDWIIITDHNTLDGLSQEGWYDGVAVIVGQEVSPDNSDHYLALGLDKVINHLQSPQDFVNEVKALGGVGFIAHPDEGRHRTCDMKKLNWTDHSIRGFDGIELWNHLSDWVDNYKPQKALYHYLFREKILTGPNKELLQWWDELNLDKEQVVPAVGGVDAHALIKKYFGLKVEIFNYFETFKTVTNVIYLDKQLSEDFEEAKKQIFAALKNGNTLIVNKHLSKGFRSPLFYIQNKEGKFFPGETLELDLYTKAIVKLPFRAKIKLIYDGQVVWETEKEELDFQHLDRGKYRVEIYRDNRPWAFSNPILIK